MRDVVSIGTGNADDQVTIRFQTDNPGPWFLHCHIDWHLNAYALFNFDYFPLLTQLCSRGLAVVFAEDVPDVSTQDIHTGTYTLFARTQQLHDSLQPSGMTFAPHTMRSSTRLERHNTIHFYTGLFYTRTFVYGLADYKDNKFTSYLQSCTHSCTAHVWTLCYSTLPNKNKTTSLAGSGPVAVLWLFPCSTSHRSSSSQSSYTFRPMRLSHVRGHVASYAM